MTAYKLNIARCANLQDFEKIRAENFEFRLILDQLRNQMDNLGDANTNHVLHENMELKANKARLTQDLKRHAKLAKQAESALAAVIAERDTAEQRAREMAKMVKEQGGGRAGDVDGLKERIEELERLLVEAEEDADNLRREMEEGDAEEVQRLKVSPGPTWPRALFANGRFHRMHSTTLKNPSNIGKLLPKNARNNSMTFGKICFQRPMHETVQRMHSLVGVRQKTRRRENGS